MVRGTQLRPLGVAVLLVEEVEEEQGVEQLARTLARPLNRLLFFALSREDEDADGVDEEEEEEEVVVVGIESSTLARRTSIRR